MVSNLSDGVCPSSKSSLACAFSRCCSAFAAVSIACFSVFAAVSIAFSPLAAPTFIPKKAPTIVPTVPTRDTSTTLADFEGYRIPKSVFL